MRQAAWWTSAAVLAPEQLPEPAGGDDRERNLRRHREHIAIASDDGSDALPLLDTGPFDLVITDAYMSGVDGMELLVRIQQRGNPVPVVMISGGGHLTPERVLAMAQGCGAVATLEKPFTVEQLRRTIDPLLAPPPAPTP